MSMSITLIILVTLLELISCLFCHNLWPRMGSGNVLLFVYLFMQYFFLKKKACVSD